MLSDLFTLMVDRAGGRTVHHGSMSPRELRCLDALRRCAADTAAPALSVRGYERWHREHRSEPSASVIVRAFGSWSASLDRAELQTRSDLFCTPTLFEALRRWERSLGPGSDCSSAGYDAWARQNNGPSRAVLNARLGSWSDALQAAGVQLERPARPRARSRGDEDLVQGVRDYLATLAPEAAVSSSGYDRWAKANGRHALRTLVNRLGPWREILAPLGRQATRGGGTRKRSGQVRYTDDQLRQVLRDHAATLPPGQGVAASRYGRWAVQNGAPSTATILKRLGAGSWIDAVAAAGLGSSGTQRAPVRREEFSVHEHAQALRDCARALGVPAPTLRAYDAWRSDRPIGSLPSSAAIRTRHGSWSAAVQAAGLGQG